MVQATDFGDLNDPATFRRLNRPPVWCILIEREVSSGPMIVRDVAGQDAAQVLFTKDEDVIETLAPDGADEPLRERVLPRAVRRGQDFTDSHALHALPLHPAQALASPTQRSRSVARNFGLVTVRLYTESCWRKARFSRTRWW
jgi:hypothetical protein